MSTHLEIAAVHGWGFDRSCWDGWRQEWKGRARFSAADRGYFGTPGEAGWGAEPSGTRILLVHSMGLLFCPPHLLERADVVVLFSCFLRFHPEDGSAARSRRVVERMRRRLRLRPDSVLTDFWERCGTVRAPAPSQPSVGRLHDDLELLDRGRAHPDRMRHARSILVLHGRRDRIVPEASGKRLHAALPERARFSAVEGAGHALPFTHMGACRRLLDHVLAESTS